MRRRILTRRRIIVVIAAVGAVLVAAWWPGRYWIARWAVHRALTGAGLQPATFDVRSVGLEGIRVTNLAVGSWLSAASLDATYSPRSLLSARVREVRLQGAVWTIRSNDGVIDWGFTPPPRRGPLTLDMPLERLDITDSTLRVLLNDTTYDTPVSGHLAPSAPEALDASLHARIRDREVSVGVEATNDSTHLGLRIEVEAASRESTQALVTARVLRPHSGESTSVSATATLTSLAENLGGTALTLAQADMSGTATLDDSGRLLGLTAVADGRDLHIGAVAIRTFDFNTAKLEGNQFRINAAAAGDQWQLPAAAGRVQWKASPEGTIISADLHTGSPVVLTLRDTGEGQIQSVTARVAVQARPGGIAILDGGLAASGGSFTAGDVSIADADAAVTVNGADSVEVTRLAAVLGDGGTIKAAPFTFDPRDPHPATRVTVENLSLADWLPLLTGDRATGQGRISGYADAALDFTGPMPRVTRLTGSLAASPSHGYIQVSDAEAVGDLLEQQDPRFAEGQLMAPVREKIVAALRDFAFNTLTVDLSRSGDRTIALTRLSGFGRHGQDPQGLNLTLDLQAQDAFLQLASRIAGRARMRDAAADALNRFFQEAP